MILQHFEQEKHGLWQRCCMLLLLMIMALMLVGCKAIIKPLEPKVKPVPISFPLQAPDGPAVYQQGWHDGCRSGLSSTNELVRPEFRFYKYNVDQNLQFNPTYWRVWQDAYDYCAFTMLTMMKHHS